jgi:RimJ/RimL family protein N-acetyltransferase
MRWAVDITMEGNQRYTAEAERSWQAGEEFHFAILEDGLVLGVVALNRHHEASAELHYWIRSDRTGCGYTTEAGERILRWGVEKLGFVDTGPLPEPMDGGLGSFPAQSYERSAKGRHDLAD